MANTIRLKRGSGSDPGTSDLVVGEVAVRTDNGKLFTKKDDGTIAEISGSGGGGISDGDKGDITVSNSGATFTIDSGVVTSAKIADGTIVNADISGSAAIEGSKIQAAGLINAGVMTAAQNNKLAGIEDNATADMTGSEILSTISGENIILGEISSTGNSSFAGNITVSSSDGGSSAAPELDLYRISASPADADYLGQIKFTGESDDGSKEVYAKITGKIGDASSGTEDGILEIAHRKAGSNNISARFTSTDLKLINGTGLEVAGTISSSGNLSITNSTPTISLVDSDNNPNYDLKNVNGVFKINDSTSPITRLSVASDGTVDVAGNLDVGSGVDVTGDITTTGDLTINSTRPRITLNDTDSESDFEIKNENGSFRIRDIDNPTDRYKINTSGTVHEFLGSAAFSSTLNVVSNITVGGTVDGRDLATDGSKLDGIESGATADQTKSDIDALGIAASTATTLATARTIAGVSFDGSANISLNNNAITNGAGYITSSDSSITDKLPLAGGTMTGMLVVSDTIPKIRLMDTNNNPDYELNDTNGVFNIRDNSNATNRFSIGTDGAITVNDSLTSPRISGSNGILEVKQEIGTSQTLTSGYNAIAVDPTIANGVTITVPSGATWSIV